MPGHGEADGIGRDEAASGLDAGHAMSVAPDAGDLAVLDDVDTGFRGRARVAPGDRIVAHGAATPLQEPAEYGVAAIVEINERHERLDRLAAQWLRHPRRAAASCWRAA